MKKSPRSRPSKKKAIAKPSAKVSVKASGKRISKGLQKYWAKIREIKESYGVKDIRTARNIYKTREKVSQSRFERFAFERREDFPPYVSRRMIRKFGKRLERGKDRGKIVLYWDKLKAEPIKGKTALRMRYENTVSRLALRAQELNMTQQRYFVDRFWPAYAKKRGYLTEFEAKRLIRKLLSLRRKDPIIRRQMRNIYGY